MLLGIGSRNDVIRVWPEDFLQSPVCKMSRSVLSGCKSFDPVEFIPGNSKGVGKHLLAHLEAIPANDAEPMPHLRSEDRRNTLKERLQRIRSLHPAIAHSSSPPIGAFSNTAINSDALVMNSAATPSITVFFFAATFSRKST